MEIVFILNHTKTLAILAIELIRPCNKVMGPKMVKKFLPLCFEICRIGMNREASRYQNGVSPLLP